MTDLDLNQIEARAAAATEGPWVAEYSGEQGNCVIPGDAESTREAVCVTRLFNQTADAEFIAASRSEVPELASRVRELEATIERVRWLAMCGLVGKIRALLDPKEEL